MRANEFVKKFGWDEAKRIINPPFKGYLPQVDVDNVDFSFEDLKRLVESHELVEKVGGIDAAYDEAGSYYTNESRMIEISQAIADVESCND